MKKIIMLSVIFVGLFSLSACDLIEDEIERAESIELEDFQVLLHEQSVLLKITSDADEQVIEGVVVNDEEYDLVSQGDDWYLLDEVPIEKEYEIGDVNYLTGVGVSLSFNVGQSFDIQEGLDNASDDLVHEIDQEVTIGEYTFSLSEDELVAIETEQDYTTEELDDWAHLIIENEEPLFVVLEYNETLYVIEAPDEVNDYIVD